MPKVAQRIRNKLGKISARSTQRFGGHFRKTNGWCMNPPPPVRARVNAIFDHFMSIYATCMTKKKHCMPEKTTLPEMLLIPCAGILFAPHRRRRHKKHAASYGVCLFTKFGDSAIQRLACRRVISFFGISLAAHVKGTAHPEKGAKPRIRLFACLFIRV